MLTSERTTAQGAEIKAALLALAMLAVAIGTLVAFFHSPIKREDAGEI